MSGDSTGEVDEPVFRRSSFCCSGACVAVAFIPGAVLVRHHRGSATVLEFSRAEWQAFLEGVRAGEFDVPPERDGQPRVR